ncbi:MAG TPA: sugar phosphate isomerase/epimerase family protein [Blastocatellia bacterium]|nr:sugar phosphate isomerase/epimerase family protein [Blastocatellia bacterium]
MNTRREFLKTSSLGAAATLLPQNDLIDAPASTPAQDGRLKKGVLITMLPKQMSYLDRFKLAVDAGFEGVEAQTVVDPKEADQIKEASEKAKIRIHSVMNMGHWEWPFSSLNPDDVKKGAERMEISLRNAKLWGADTVLLVPAVVRPDTTIPQAWSRSQPHIRKLLPLARELGVVIAIEPVWNKFLLTPHDTAKYVDEFKSPWVKAYFDVGNVVMYGFPQEWIRTLGKRIVKFHLKDFKYETRQWVPLREGSIDWKEVRKAIGEIGFSGYLTVELQGGDEAYLREVSRRVDMILAGE